MATPKPPPLELDTLLRNLASATTVGKLRALHELRERITATLDTLELELIRQARFAEQAPLAEIGRAVSASKSTVSRWIGQGRITRSN